MLFALLVQFAAGCGRNEPAPVAQDQSLRIVSLSPAISRTLIDFDLDDHIVGRTPFCEALDQQIPVVGDLLNLDYERLVRIRPSHVLVQPPAAGIDPQLIALAERHGWTVGQWRLNNVKDVKRLLSEIPEVLGDDALIEQAVELELRIEDSLRLEPDAWDGTVLLVASTDPVGVFGTETYLNDVLTSLGARNAVSLSHYPQLTLEDVIRIDPQAIVLVRPGASGDLDPMAALRALRSLPIEANRLGRVSILRHKDAFLPSSGTIGVADEMREILRSFKSAQQPNAGGER